MREEIISFIRVSYNELAVMDKNYLEKKITENLKPVYENIHSMNLDQKIKMREDVKNTRKEKFRFSQEITKDIPKDRIQIALTHLAELFRKLDNDIKKSKQGNT